MEKWFIEKKYICQLYQERIQTIKKLKDKIHKREQIIVIKIIIKLESIFKKKEKIPNN